MKNLINLKSALVVAFFAVTSMPLLAQQGDRDRPAPPQRQAMTEASVKERTIKLSENLGCTDDQQKKLLDFELAQFKANQAQREKFEGDREAMRSYMQEQRKLRDEKYAEILTPDQLKKYNQMMEERRQQRSSGSQSSEGQRSRGRGGN